MVSKTTRILLVEDNPADAYLVKDFLNDASIRFDLEETNNLYDAFEIIEQGNIEIVLLDLTLPDSQGFKTLSSILERRIDIPVVVLTGMNNEIVGNQAIKAGAQDFLVKGQFDGKHLGRAIRYALQRHRDSQKRSELVDQLAVSEKRYMDAQSIGHFGHWVMDIVSNEMMWTEEVYRIFGIQPNSLQPSFSQYLNYVYKQDRAEVEQFFEETLKSGKQATLEHRIVLDGRHIAHVSLSARIQMADYDQKICLVGVVQDISDRKKAEQLLKERNISENTGKIKDEALADLGFHIRTPLSTIVNLLYLLDSTSVSTSQRELLDDLSASVDDLSIIINNLLNLSVFGAERIKIEEQNFTVRDLLQSVKKLGQIKAEKSNKNLRFKVDKTIPERCNGDEKKITQILYNLLHVAFLNANDKHDINSTISFENRDSNNTLFHCDISYVSEKRIELPKEGVNKDNYSIWSASLESNNDSPTGFGLAIAKKLCELLGGEFGFDFDDATKDCKIYISLPLTTVITTNFNPGDVPKEALRVLLVEDHFLNQIATKKVLLAWTEEITVDIAENGLIGVEKFREHGYDLILMDIQMPVMNGIDSARRIRETSQVPIIALTANATRLEMDKCLEVGMNDYLQKPFKPQDLYAKILSSMAAV